ncbi:unnamed protein product [Sphenostylis stenocarpa]|uniref:Gamma-interferon-inducible lysosomal thiol reductase n=1 Tax=Sphenostylis stenocarpa TaxID=92480 RepID=A0AA86S9G9_9FABA|nr:unnamed protein product [Sphenostylis stenocarpa]
MLLSLKWLGNGCCKWLEMLSSERCIPLQDLALQIELRVSVSLYYESLCPYCADFIVNHLVRLFQTDLISIVNLRLVPWGNAWISSDASLICQHGEDECFLNTIEACAITLYPDVVQHFRFVECLERLSLEGRHRQWMNCFQITGFGTSPIDCYTSGNGKTIDTKYAKETSKLNPPHRFVPWVVVNDQALQEDYRNFVTYICRAYKGNVIPSACSLMPKLKESMEEVETLTTMEVQIITRKCAHFVGEQGTQWKPIISANSMSTNSEIAFNVANDLTKIEYLGEEITINPGE